MQTQGQQPVQSLAVGADQADAVLHSLAHTPEDEPRAAAPSDSGPSVAEPGAAVGTAAIVADLTASGAAAGAQPLNSMSRPGCGQLGCDTLRSPRIARSSSHHVHSHALAEAQVLETTM